MADAAHKKTDEYIAEIQKRVTREYRAAEKDAQKKLEDYLKRFAEKDRKQREKLEAGEITKAQYQEWRRRQIVTGERWKALRDTIAKDYHNASQIAQKIAKDKLPDVYALNHNYATYSIENEAGINTSYTLYNHSTVERMLRENPKLLPDPTPGSATAARLAANKDLRWNQQHIQSAVTRGIMLGDDIGSIAKRLRSVTDMDYSASMRNARTAVTGAQNAGREDAFERAESMGIEIVREWVATLDSRTRDSHRAMHGEERDEKSGTFSNGLEYPGDTAGPPEEVYNCRCTMISHVAGHDVGIPKMSPKMQGQSFEEWQEGRKPKRTLGAGEAGKSEKNYRQIGEVDYRDKKAVRAELERFERENRDASEEHAVVVTRTGKVFACDGGLKTVNIEVGESLNGAYVSHNHVRTETQYSFGEDDRITFNNSRLAVLRGTDYKYEYELTRDGGTIDPYPSLEEMLDDPTLAEHAFTVSFAERFGYGYRRKEL